MIFSKQTLLRGAGRLRPGSLLPGALLPGALLVGALMGGGAAGCVEEHAPSAAWKEPLRLSDGLEVGGDMFFVNQSFEQLIRLRPQRSGKSIRLKIERAATGEDPGAFALSADEKRLFLVNEMHAAQGATLGVYDLGGEKLAAQTVALDSAYDRLSVDPAGEFLLLSFTGESGTFVARNLNELGIVDLRQPISAGARARFETLSSRARGIEFAPPFELGGQPQRLAVALSPSEITLVDLLATDAQNRLREVPLTISQADQVRTPVQAIFDVTTDRDSFDPDLLTAARLYLLTDVGSDIVQVTIQPSLYPEAGRKFDISVNQLAAGSSPVKMRLLDLGAGGTRLIAIDGSRPRFTLIDVHTGESATFDLPMTAAASDLLVYEVVDERAAEPVREVRVLAWSSRSNLAAVIRPEGIAMGDQVSTPGRSVQAIRLQGTPVSVEFDKDAARPRAIARYGGSNGGFSVLNLDLNRAVPIQGASLEDVYFGPQNAYGVFRGQPYFGVFDLETGHPSTFELPAEGKRIYVNEAQELVVVQHQDRTGRFTVLDAQRPNPENARVYNHVFLEDLFAQDLP